MRWRGESALPSTPMSPPTVKDTNEPGPLLLREPAREAPLVLWSSEESVLMSRGWGGGGRIERKKGKKGESVCNDPSKRI